jgi:hypothetical protein
VLLVNADPLIEASCFIACSTPASAADKAFCELAKSVELLKFVILLVAMVNPTVKAITITNTTTRSACPVCILNTELLMFLFIKRL